MVLIDGTDEHVSDPVGSAASWPNKDPLPIDHFDRPGYAVVEGLHAQPGYESEHIVHVRSS
jgi:hypothetical protein